MMAEVDEREMSLDRKETVQSSPDLTSSALIDSTRVGFCVKAILEVVSFKVFFCDLNMKGVSLS